MDRFCLSAVGSDRPGIVAAVTGALSALGANLEDSSMVVLGGQFAIMLVLSVPPGVDELAVRSALDPVADRMDLLVSVRLVPASRSHGPEGEHWTVSVHGADRPGIVHRLTERLAAVGANIVDLSTRVVGEEDRPGYVMLIDVTLPAGTDTAALGAELAELASSLGVRCVLHPADAEIL